MAAGVWLPNRKSSLGGEAIGGLFLKWVVPSEVLPAEVPPVTGTALSNSLFTTTCWEVVDNAGQCRSDGLAPGSRFVKFISAVSSGCTIQRGHPPREVVLKKPPFILRHSK